MELCSSKMELPTCSRLIRSPDWVARLASFSSSASFSDRVSAKSKASVILVKKLDCCCVVVVVVVVVDLLVSNSAESCFSSSFAAALTKTHLGNDDVLTLPEDNGTTATFTELSLLDDDEAAGNPVGTKAPHNEHAGAAM
jgi:hypothetical protein